MKRVHFGEGSQDGPLELAQQRREARRSMLITVALFGVIVATMRIGKTVSSCLNLKLSFTFLLLRRAFHLETFVLMRT